MSEPIEMQSPKEKEDVKQENSHEPISPREHRSRSEPTDEGTLLLSPHKFSLGLSWDNISYNIKEKNREIKILKGLTGTALPGRTLAIMGSSGAGKTTFLNALADRLRSDSTHVLNGNMRLNDLPFDHRYRCLLGFVTQEDIVSPMSTPEDAFRFSLRIRRGTSEEETTTKVEEMLAELKLSHVRHTLVGIPGILSGLSGGEKKRTNIGVELISDPKVLLLDEPTSGLDSVTASRIVEICRDLALHGRTVIFTIHQPTADCVSYFDDLMLMCSGSVAYHGTMADSHAYFASIGYPCPENYTPTDFYMILLQDKEIGPKLVDLWTKHLEEGYMSAHVTSPGSPVAAGNLNESLYPGLPDASQTKAYLEDYVSHHGSGVFIQFSELMKRSFHNVSRDKMFLAMSIVQGVFFALIAGVIFVNTKDDVQGVQDRMGLFFMVAANRGFGGAMTVINTFPSEKAVFIREQQSGSYSPGIYFLAKSLSELPIQLVSTLIESVIIYFMTGLVMDAGRFFHYVAIAFALFQGATGLGMAISCVCPNFELASGLAPLALIPMMLAGGLLGSVDRLRPYWVWLEKISIIRYGYILFVKNEFDGVKEIYCYPNSFVGVNGTDFCMRQPKTGAEVLKAFEITGTDHSYWLLWLCLIIWIVVMRMVAVLALNVIARSKE